ncbi:MAG: hypothetical protein M3R59_06720 [Verrucomicrobiota bacterium]|nr:hypothetical protein [Verrucomicrobiota bacterium]
MNDVLSALDELIQQRSILQHRFYRAWQEGTLTRTQLATYARVYYPHVAAFPDYLRNTIALTSDDAICAELKENLADELAHPAPHPEL